MKRFLSENALPLLSLLLSAIAIVCSVSSTVITNESLVITFIGVIASLIVIGNVSQVYEIKHELKEQIKVLESRIKYAETFIEIQNQKQDEDLKIQNGGTDDTGRI